MEMNDLSDLARAYAGISATYIGTAIACGAIIAIVLLLLYRWLGVFRRSSSKLHNWLVKLWIPYVLIIIGIFAFKIGSVRTVQYVASESKQAGVDVLYDRAIAPALGDPMERAMMLASAQGAGASMRDMGRMAASRMKEQFASNPEQDFGSRLGNKLAAKVIDRYADDLVAAVLHGLLGRSEEALGVRLTEAPLTVTDVASSLDLLLSTDLTTAEATIKQNLNSLLDRVIKDQFGAMIKMDVLIAAALLLLPLLEWWIYRRRKAKNAQPGTEAPSVVS